MPAILWGNYLLFNLKVACDITINRAQKCFNCSGTNLSHVRTKTYRKPSTYRHNRCFYVGDFENPLKYDGGIVLIFLTFGINHQK